MNAELIKLLEDYCGADPHMTRNTKLFHDLHLYGDDAAEFIDSFKDIKSIQCLFDCLRQIEPYKRHIRRRVFFNFIYFSNFDYHITIKKILF